VTSRAAEEPNQYILIGRNWSCHKSPFPFRWREHHRSGHRSRLHTFTKESHTKTIEQTLLSPQLHGSLEPLVVPHNLRAAAR
jgi:hypothetical protein